MCVCVWGGYSLKLLASYLHTFFNYYYKINILAGTVKGSDRKQRSIWKEFFFFFFLQNNTTFFFEWQPAVFSRLSFLVKPGRQTAHHKPAKMASIAQPCHWSHRHRPPIRLITWLPSACWQQPGPEKLTLAPPNWTENLVEWLGLSLCLFSSLFVVRLYLHKPGLNHSKRSLSPGSTSASSLSLGQQSSNFFVFLFFSSSSFCSFFAARPALSSQFAYTTLW